MRILIFNWNAGQLAICETISKQAAEDARGNFLKRIIRAPCALPDFFRQVETIIDEKQPDLLIFYTIDAGMGSKFHSDFLPNFLGQLQFRGLIRGKEERTSEEGKVRVSAYGYSEIIEKIRVFTDGAESCPINDGVITRIGGALSFRLKILGVGVIGFMGVALPDSSKSLVGYSSSRMQSERAAILDANRLCLRAAFQRFWGDLSVEDKPMIGFVFGDLNYHVSRAVSEDDLSELSPAELQYSALGKDDELKGELTQKGSPLFGYQEGKGGAGPQFLPDWPHLLNRDAQCQQSGLCFDYNKGFPSWTTRILSKKLGRSTFNLTCESYERFDFGNIRLSEHTAVIGVYNLEAPTRK